MGIEAHDAAEGQAERAAKHSLPLAAPCANCGASLQGAWCHACGQKAEAFHRSIWHLAAEAFEGLTHFDGRFWNTLPRLVLKPGQLTRDYLDGRRASQIPPFRMFLVVLLAVFFTGALALKHERVVFRVDHTSDIVIDTGSKASTAWATERVSHALREPEALLTAMEHWSHQFAILMLPIAAALLSLLYATRRDVYVFDHLIFSMHSLAFQGLLLSAVFLLGLVTPWSGWLLCLAPVHLFVHMRGTYGDGAIPVLARMLALFVGSAAAFTLLMAGLVFVGLATAH